MWVGIILIIIFLIAVLLSINSTLQIMKKRQSRQYRLQVVKTEKKRCTGKRVARYHGRIVSPNGEILYSGEQVFNHDDCRAVLENFSRRMMQGSFVIEEVEQK